MYRPPPSGPALRCRGPGFLAAWLQHWISSDRAVLVGRGPCCAGCLRCRLESSRDASTEIAHLALRHFRNHSVSLRDQAGEISGVTVGARHVFLRESAPASTQHTVEAPPLIGNNIVAHQYFLLTRSSAGCRTIAARP